MRLKNRMAVVGGAFLVCLSWCLFAPGPVASQEAINLKAATVYPLKHRMVTDCFDIYSQEIEKRTNGKVKMTWFHASSLVSQDKMRDAVASGMVDLGWLSVSMDPHLFPVSQGLSLPFMVDSALGAAMAGHEMWQRIPEMKAEWSAFKFLGMGSTDIANIAWVKKIAPKTPEEMKGLRVGTPYAQIIPIIKLWPLSAQFIKMEDVYLALQRNMLDGIICPNAALRSFKYTDVTEGHTMGDFIVFSFVWAMRKETWEKLPSDVKKVFDDLNPSLTLLAGHTLTNEGLWVIDALKKRGDAFYYLTPEDKAKWKQPLMPVFDDYVAKLNEKGFDGKAILAKVEQIADETRKKPADKIEDWWKAGKMGKQEGQ